MRGGTEGLRISQIPRGLDHRARVEIAKILEVLGYQRERELCSQWV